MCIDVFLTGIPVSPTNFIGPFAEDFVITPGVVSDLSSAVTLYGFFAGPEKMFYNLPVGHVDVRDVAAAMVAGIKVKGNHRLLLTGEWFDWADGVKYIANTRPELAHRLVKIGHTGQTRSAIDNKKALEVLGITLTPWKKTIDDGFNDVLKVEKDWIERGIDLSGLKNSDWAAMGERVGHLRVEFTD